MKTEHKKYLVMGAFAVAAIMIGSGINSALHTANVNSAYHDFPGVFDVPDFFYDGRDKNRPYSKRSISNYNEHWRQVYRGNARYPNDPRFKTNPDLIEEPSEPEFIPPPVPELLCDRFFADLMTLEAGIIDITANRYSTEIELEFELLWDRLDQYCGVEEPTADLDWPTEELGDIDHYYPECEGLIGAARAACISGQ